MYYYESNNYRTWRGMQKVKLKKQLKNLESERIIREIIELQKEIEEYNKIDSAAIRRKMYSAIRRKEEWRNKEYQKKSKNENDEIIDDRRQNEYDGAVVFFIQNPNDLTDEEKANLIPSCWIYYEEDEWKVNKKQMKTVDYVA